jgi:hypothetical protein
MAETEGLHLNNESNITLECVTCGDDVTVNRYTIERSKENPRGLEGRAVVADEVTCAACFATKKRKDRIAAIAAKGDRARNVQEEDES